MEYDFTGRRAAFLSLGCKVNSCETDAMKETFAEAGAEIVDFAEKADIYVVNTCSVTNIADRKSRQMLHRAKKLSPEAVVVATGCYAQVAGEELLADSAVDLVVGNNRKSHLAEDVYEYILNGSGTDLSDISKEKDFEELEVKDAFERCRAYIKIQDGCNQFCTYCIIPYARGRIRSRSEENILKEVERLANGGYKEIVLTGIHISSYGMEREEKSNAFEGNSYLISLIERIAGVDGIERIRLGSLEPRLVTEEFARRMSKCEKLCPHFHLSLQSGCDNTLRRMNRHYSAQEFYESCTVLRSFFENPAITTDVIVGFPQESEEDHTESKSFLEKVSFSKMHVFKYSRRKGTVADRMPGQISEQVKSQRSDELIELDRKLGGQYRSSFIGTTQRVLFEERVTIGGQEYFLGHNERYVRIAVKTEENFENRIIDVKVTDFVDEETLEGII